MISLSIFLYSDKLQLVLQFTLGPFLWLYSVYMGQRWAPFFDRTISTKCQNLRGDQNTLLISVIWPRIMSSCLHECHAGVGSAITTPTWLRHCNLSTCSFYHIRRAVTYIHLEKHNYTLHMIYPVYPSQECLAVASN